MTAYVILFQHSYFRGSQTMCRISALFAKTHSLTNTPCRECARLVRHVCATKERPYEDFTD